MQGRAPSWEGPSLSWALKDKAGKYMVVGVWDRWLSKEREPSCGTIGSSCLGLRTLGLKIKGVNELFAPVLLVWQPEQVLLHI